MVYSNHLFSLPLSSSPSCFGPFDQTEMLVSAWPDSAVRELLAEFSGDPSGLQTKGLCNTLHLSYMPLYFIYLSFTQKWTKSALLPDTEHLQAPAEVSVSQEKRE